MPMGKAKRKPGAYSGDGSLQSMRQHYGANSPSTTKRSHSAETRKKISKGLKAHHARKPRK